MSISFESEEQAEEWVRAIRRVIEGKNANDDSSKPATGSGTARETFKSNSKAESEKSAETEALVTSKGQKIPYYKPKIEDSGELD